mgnify:FL=1
MTGLEFGHFVLLFNIKQVAFSAETLVVKRDTRGKCEKEKHYVTSKRSKTII